MFQDAKTRLAELGKSYEQSNKRLAAAGAVLKYKKQLDDLRGKQGQIGDAEKKALAAAEKRFAAAKKAAKRYGIEVGNAAAEHRRLTAEVGRMGREKRALERKEGVGPAWTPCAPASGSSPLARGTPGPLSERAPEGLSAVPQARGEVMRRRYWSRARIGPGVRTNHGTGRVRWLAPHPRRRSHPTATGGDS